MCVRSRLGATAALVCVIAAASALPGGSSFAAPAGTGSTAPSTARNGEIAFRRWLDSSQSAGALFVAGASGTGEQQVTRPEPGVEDGRPDWSPDGSLLVFQRCRIACAVYTVQPDGTGLKNLSPGDGASDESLPTFLPDGRHIVFTRASGGVRTFPGGDQINHSDIVVMDLDGGSRHVLARAAPYKADLENAMFAPNGLRVVYEHRRSHFVDPETRRALVVARATGADRRRITPWSLDAGDGADWSPDGAWILFRSHESGDAQGQFYVIRPDGTDMRQLTHFEDGTWIGSASFSPDGRWITFAKAGRGGAADVFVMRADGSGIRPVTRTVLWDSAPDWGSAG